MTLNKHLDWPQMAQVDGGKVGSALQLAFGSPNKELLLPGMSIYKINGFATITRHEPPQPTDDLSP